MGALRVLLAACALASATATEVVTLAELESRLQKLKQRRSEMAVTEKGRLNSMLERLEELKHGVLKEVIPASATPKKTMHDAESRSASKSKAPHSEAATLERKRGGAAEVKPRGRGQGHGEGRRAVEGAPHEDG